MLDMTLSPVFRSDEAVQILRSAGVWSRLDSAARGQADAINRIKQDLPLILDSRYIDTGRLAADPGEAVGIEFVQEFFFLILFRSVLQTVGIKTEDLGLCCELNFCIKGTITAADNLFDDQDKALLPLKLGQGSRLRSILHLLALEQPVVSALILQRAAPFLPTAYAERDEDGNYLTLDLKSVGHNNLVQVAATGTGGLLVRAEIFQELGPPWFVYSEDFGEDMYFANRLAEAGIPMLLDTGCRMGHLAPAGIFPFWGPAGWQAEFKYSDGTTIPIALEHKEKSS